EHAVRRGDDASSGRQDAAGEERSAPAESLARVVRHGSGGVHVALLQRTTDCPGAGRRTSRRASGPSSKKRVAAKSVSRETRSTMTSGALALHSKVNAPRATDVGVAATRKKRSYGVWKRCPPAGRISSVVASRRRTSTLPGGIEATSHFGNGALLRSIA